jgi:hypothetical protein
MKNILNKRLLISCSTQTNVKNKKSLRNRVTSCTNIKLKLDQSPSNNQFNNRIVSSHFKGKKLSKKKKKLDLYNNLFSNNNKLTEKDDFSHKIKNAKHENGKFTLLFGGYESNNKPVINGHKLNILRKISMNNINNNIIFDNKELKKRLIKLPIYNIKKLLNKKNILLNGLSNNNTKTCENNNMKSLYEAVKTNFKEKLVNENFPMILNKEKNMNSCTDIKRNNNDIINNIFKRKLFNDKTDLSVSYLKSSTSEGNSRRDLIDKKDLYDNNISENINEENPATKRKKIPRKSLYNSNNITYINDKYKIDEENKNEENIDDNDDEGLLRETNESITSLKGMDIYKCKEDSKSDSKYFELKPNEE